MAHHPARPPLRAPTERRLKASLAHGQLHGQLHGQQHAHRFVHSSTRRSSRAAAPLVALADDTSSRPAPQRTPHASTAPAAPTAAAAPIAATAPTASTITRTSLRKRPATALPSASPETRPPTKVTVAQPHGQLFRITNGVPAALALGQDDVPSGISTPDTNGAPALIAPAQPPPPSSLAQDKRSLRSHDGGSRLKSDLTIYFSNYDDVIAGVPASPEFLALETPIYIVDEPVIRTSKSRVTASPEPSRASASPDRSRKRHPTPLRKASVVSVPPTQSSTSFQVLDYSSISRHIRDDEDPLGDDVFFTQHRRAERKEKQLRNIEKERAMHEKVQLERLLDGLQGPDWLKVMGITGVTDGDRKDWEPKRDYFVKEVEALVDKFRLWKEEEKRLRAEKEAALAVREDEDDNEEESAESDVANVNGAEPSALPERHQPRAEQKPPQPRRPPKPHGYFLPIPPPEPQKPFTSFYAKPHLRAAALGKHRHGRNASAFGLPIPDFVEHEFSPPEELLTVEALRDHARKRRRQKRESTANTDKQ